MKIIHAADIHLGCRRLDGRLPDSDFTVAFDHIADQAIARKANEFLLAGEPSSRCKSATLQPCNFNQARMSSRFLALRQSVLRQ